MKKLMLLTIAAAAAASLSHAAFAAVIYNNGPVVDGTGKSVLTLPATTLGFGQQTTAGNSVADDFTIGAGSQWAIGGIDFFGYQTGSVAFTFQTATWSIVSGDVNTGTVMASGVTNVTDGGLVGYRVSSTALTGTTRGIYRAQADITDVTLDPGQYWLRWSLTGSLASGPWQPPTSDAQTGNAMQSTTGGSFATLTDAGSLLTVSLPFALQGAVVAVPEPSSYALMLAGGLGVMAIVRRRRQQHG